MQSRSRCRSEMDYGGSFVREIDKHGLESICMNDK